MEDWGAIERWMGGALEKVGSLDIPLLTDYLDLSRDEEETGVSRTRPFMAHMTVSRIDCLYSSLLIDSSGGIKTCTARISLH